MPCIGCLHWIPPRYTAQPGHGGRTGKSNPGVCKKDDNPSHPYYHCTRFTSASGNGLDTLGLTEAEIVFLRAHDWAPGPARLINLYQMVLRAPGDPGARALFDIALKDWRARGFGPRD